MEATQTLTAQTLRTQGIDTEPELIEESKTYLVTCPRCHTPKSLRAKLTGKTKSPGIIEWNVVCKACDYQEGWFQGGSPRWTSK